jgi:Na+/citrate or Na+/malate symporter
MSEREGPEFDSAFWFQWIVATTLGWLLGGYLLANLPILPGGIGAGALQWPILYRRVPRAWRWPVATALGWLAGALLLLFTVPADLNPWLAGLVIGPIVGLGQWLILRSEVHWAGWWVIISTVAWTTGLLLVPGALSTGSLAGAITGVALMLLFRAPKHEAPVQEENA